MKERLHQFMLTCDGCGRKILVLHTGEPPYPKDWREFFKEDGFGEKLDFCPRCVSSWKAQNPG